MSSVYAWYNIQSCPASSVIIREQCPGEVNSLLPFRTMFVMHTHHIIPVLVRIRSENAAGTSCYKPVCPSFGIITGRYYQIIPSVPFEHDGRLILPSGHFPSFLGIFIFDSSPVGCQFKDTYAAETSPEKIVPAVFLIKIRIYGNINPCSLLSIILPRSVNGPAGLSDTATPIACL